MRALPIAAILAVVASLPPAAQARVLEEFEAADWGGMAYADAGSGGLSHCVVFARYPNGATLTFSHDREGEWILSVVEEGWALRPEALYPVRYRVDGGAETRAAAYGIAGNQLGLALEADDPLIEQIRRGFELTVTFRGEDYRFELGNSNRALREAQDCVERHRGATAAVGAEPAGAEGGADVPRSNEGKAQSKASIIGERQAFGPWVVVATDDGDGNFVNCTAFGSQGDDQIIMSYRPDESWEFGLYRTDWALETGKTYQLWYNVDRSVYEPGVVKRPVQAVEPTRIVFQLGELEDVVGRMEDGAALHVQLRGASRFPHRLYYPLEQTEAALDATRRCTMSYSRTAQAEVAEAAPADKSKKGAAAPTLPEMGDIEVDTFELAGWEGAAYADFGGRFTHCSIRARYRNGTALSFMSAADGTLVMALDRSDWTLEPGTYSPVEYTHDGGTSPIAMETEGMAVNATLYAVALGREDSVVRRLRATPDLTVETQGHRLRFDIRDIGPGLDAIERCVERHDRPQVEALPRPSGRGGAEPAETEGSLPAAGGGNRVIR